MNCHCGGLISWVLHVRFCVGIFVLVGNLPILKIKAFLVNHLSLPAIDIPVACISF